MTTTEVATLKRTELQAAACRAFGKSAAAWTGRATNEELREALMTGEVPAKFVNGTGQPDLAVAIAAAINPLLQAQLDEQRVMELIEGRVAELATFVEAKLAEGVKTFEVHRPDGTTINVGRTHRQFEELLSWVDAGCYPFLIGPAGSFKTSAAAKVAEALGQPFHMDSMSEGKTPSICLGLTMRPGKAVHTELRRAWEHGGVFLCDEMDAGNANVLATLNALLSQPIAAFPDGMIPRHQAFVFIAAGNTTGAGADMKFVGRNQLDGATLDRFVFVFWEIDEDYEVFVAGDDQREWTHYVQKCRRAAVVCGITENVVFATPRASINGAKALRRGKLSRSQVEQALLWGRLSAEDAAGEGEGQPVADLRRRPMTRRLNRPRGGMFVNKEFASFTAFVNAAASGPDYQRQAGRSGCATLGEAVDLARHGWPEGWQRMKTLRDAIFAKMASQIHRDVMQFRIAGGAVNVARFLSGRPDCFMARVRSNQVKDLRSRKVLRMVVNVGARASVSADTFFARGAAAVTIIEALERAGIRVQVGMLSLATNGSGRQVRVACRLKEAAEVVQLDKLAFCLAHPALHRKLNFALRLKDAGWIGGSVDVPVDQRGDIYIDAADTTTGRVWLDPAKAQAWVLTPSVWAQ